MFRPWIREHIEVHTDPFYSEVVRTDQFRPDKLAKREFDLGQTPSVSGCFDGVANGKNALGIDDIPDIEIALREGRLTQPEIDSAKRYFKNKAISEDTQAKLDEASEVARLQSDKVGSVIDNLLANSNSN